MRVPVRFTLCTAAAFLALLAGHSMAQAPGHAEGHEHAVGDSHGHSHEHPEDTAGAGQHGPSGRGGTADAALVTEPETPRAGERATLNFTLTDGAGRPLDELVTHHARELHVVIVSDDMAVLGHVHPDDFGGAIAGGEATVHFTFPRAGRYVVAVDFVTQAGTYAELFPVEVAGEAASARAGAAAPARVAVVESEGGDRYTAPVVLDGPDKAEGYEVALAGPDRVAAGEPATFTWRVTRGGAPVTDLRPYLDAAIHLAVVKDDGTEFLHEHGTAAEPGQAGLAAHGTHRNSGGGEHDAHDAERHGRGSHGHDGAASFGPELTATLTFPEPGRYHLFGQAAHGEKLLISRFPVEVN